MYLNNFIKSLDPHNSSDWLARMPMTKAAVRAMDTVTNFV